MIYRFKDFLLAGCLTNTDAKKLDPRGSSGCQRTLKLPGEVDERKNMDDLMDGLLKHFFIIAFMAVTIGIFFVGYTAGKDGRWYYILPVLLLYPILLKYFTD